MLPTFIAKTLPQLAARSWVELALDQLARDTYPDEANPLCQKPLPELPDDVFAPLVLPDTITCQLRAVFEHHDRIVVKVPHDNNLVIVIKKSNNFDKNETVLEVSNDPNIHLNLLKLRDMQSREEGLKLSVTYDTPPKVKRQSIEITATKIVVERGKP